MVDPYFITGPTIISFSGGRTSAYMLHQILQAYSGTLPGETVRKTPASGAMRAYPPPCAGETHLLTQHAGYAGAYPRLRGGDG